MKTKVFQIRVKITTNINKEKMFMKGVIISPSKSVAIKECKNQIDDWIKQTQNFKQVKDIEVIECKELRTDFIIQVKKNASN